MSCEIYNNFSPKIRVVLMCFQNVKYCCLTFGTIMYDLRMNRKMKSQADEYDELDELQNFLKTSRGSTPISPGSKM